MKILVIIPAYNEEKSILDTVEKVKSYQKIKLDYIVINDGSTDKTKEKLLDHQINFIDLSSNLGIGAAVQSGYKYALRNDYDIAVQFDGDGQHDISYIDKLIKPIVCGECDMTIGSRFVGGESGFLSTKSRRVGIKFLSLLIRLTTGKTVKDTTSGYRAAGKNIIERFAGEYTFDYPEPITNIQLIKDNFRICEVPVNMNERQYGKSSISAMKSLYYMINVGLALLVFGISGGRKKQCK